MPKLRFSLILLVVVLVFLFGTVSYLGSLSKSNTGVENNLTYGRLPSATLPDFSQQTINQSHTPIFSDAAGDLSNTNRNTTKIPTTKITQNKNTPNPTTTNPNFQQQINDLISPIVPVIPSIPTGSFFIAAPVTPTKLDLPLVSEAELTIAANGAGNLSSYAEEFLKHAVAARFSFRNYGEVLRNNIGAVMMPEEITEKALVGGDYQQIKNSALARKDFLDYKIADIKTIKVFGKGIQIQKIVIGFDRLTQNLLQKIIAMNDTGGDEQELENYYARYNKTADYYYDEVRKISSVATSAQNDSFWNRIVTALGLNRIVYAFGGTTPFGGRISVTNGCDCECSSCGKAVKVGSPRSATVFISDFTSKIFERNSPEMGHWILGNYSGGSVTCQKLYPGDPPTCGPAVPISSADGTVTIAGTS